MENNVASYQAKDYAYLLGMNGFSDILLNNHFKLYQGYVKNVNLILDKLSALLGAGNDRTLEYAELKRRFGWEFNGMRLHEFYFENVDYVMNLQLLEGLPNEEKSAKDFAQWLKETYRSEDELKDFMKKNYIPQGISLDFSNFDEFLGKRKELLRAKFKEVLQ